MKTVETVNPPHVSVQHGAGVEGRKSATVGGLLWGVQLERLRGTACKYTKQGDTVCFMQTVKNIEVTYLTQLVVFY